MDCVFCKIAQGELESDIVYEDEDIIAFKDMNPQAPVHLVIIPKEHIASTNDITSENSGYISKIFEAIAKIAKDQGFAEDGYRVVNNCGKDGQQSVKHLHFHLLAGRGFHWPPG